MIASDLDEIMPMTFKISDDNIYCNCSYVVVLPLGTNPNRRNQRAKPQGFLESSAADFLFPGLHSWIFFGQVTSIY